MPTRLFCVTDVRVSVSLTTCSSNDKHCWPSYHPLKYEAAFLELYKVLMLDVFEKGCSLWKKGHKLISQQIVCCRFNNYFGNHENLLFKFQGNSACSQWVDMSHVAKLRIESCRNGIRPMFQILLKCAVRIWAIFVCVSAWIRKGAM